VLEAGGRILMLLLRLEVEEDMPAFCHFIKDINPKLVDLTSKTDVAEQSLPGRGYLGRAERIRYPHIRIAKPKEARKISTRRLFVLC
jgi:hypothetical protein